MRAGIRWNKGLRPAPALGEFLGPRPGQLPEDRITRSSAHESEAADQQASITIKTVPCPGDTIDEIQPPLDRCPLDRCLAIGDLVWCFDHWQDVASNTEGVQYSKKLGARAKFINPLALKLQIDPLLYY